MAKLVDERALDPEGAEPVSILPDGAAHHPGCGWISRQYVEEGMAIHCPNCGLKVRPRQPTESA